MNKTEATRYFEIAADKGGIDAIYNYALTLANGHGVKMNKRYLYREYQEWEK